LEIWNSGNGGIGDGDYCWIVTGIVVMKLFDSKFIETSIAPEETLENGGRSNSIQPISAGDGKDLGECDSHCSSNGQWQASKHDIPSII
jgi:hypothetical protein